MPIAVVQEFCTPCAEVWKASVEHSIDELCARKQKCDKACRINLSKLRNGHLSYREPQIKK